MPFFFFFNACPLAANVPHYLFIYFFLQFSSPVKFATNASHLFFVLIFLPRHTCPLPSNISLFSPHQYCSFCSSSSHSFTCTHSTIHSTQHLPSPSFFIASHSSPSLLSLSSTVIISHSSSSHCHMFPSSTVLSITLRSSSSPLFLLSPLSHLLLTASPLFSSYNVIHLSTSILLHYNPLPLLSHPVCLSSPRAQVYSLSPQLISTRCLVSFNKLASPGVTSPYKYITLNLRLSVFLF